MHGAMPSFYEIFSYLPVLSPRGGARELREHQYVNTERVAFVSKRPRTVNSAAVGQTAYI